MGIDTKDIETRDVISHVDKVLSDIRQERMRQEQLKAEGRFQHTCADGIDNFRRLAILLEEVGETARACLEKGGESNDKHYVDLRKELVQVAAVATAFIEGVDRDVMRAFCPPGDVGHEERQRRAEVVREAAELRSDTRAKEE